MAVANPSQGWRMRWTSFANVCTCMLVALVLPAAAAGSISTEPVGAYQLHGSTQRLDLTPLEVLTDPQGNLTPERVAELAGQGAMSLQAEPHVPLLELDPNYTIWLKFDVTSDAVDSSD